LEYLEVILVSSLRKMYAHPFGLLVKYTNELNREYGDILDYIHQNALDGDIIGLEKYIRDKVNGSFTSIIERFFVEYESYENADN